MRQKAARLFRALILIISTEAFTGGRRGAPLFGSTPFIFIAPFILLPFEFEVGMDKIQR